MRDAQRAFGDAIDTIGLTAGVDRGMVSAAFTQTLQVDLLSAEAMANIGVDLDGGMALFSGEIDPTLVVHLAEPQKLQAFITHQRERGMASQSLMVEGVEVSTAKVDSQLSVSWAIDHEWLFMHLSFALHGDTSDWFGASRRTGEPTWGAQWDNAQKLAQKPGGVIGILDLRAFTAKLATHVPAFAACARQFEAVNGIGVALDAEGPWVSGKLAVDVGGAAQAIGAAVLPPPPGWGTASAKAPLSAQWNLDARTAAAWVQPCLPEGPDLAVMIHQFGIRTGRGFVHKLDPDDKSGTGVVAFDLSRSNYFAAQLDQIPMRSKFESSRQFGAYKGKHLSVPFVATADYVLDDHVFIAAMGDGQLERAASGAPPATPPPVFAFDALPPGLSNDTWSWIFEAVGLAPAISKRLAQRLQGWADLHLTAILDGTQLVIQAQGNRR
jgi:hypothetical protein